MISYKNQPIKPKISPVSQSNHEKNKDFHEKYIPNAILDITVI
jgi:hypothetical protein